MQECGDGEAAVEMFHSRGSPEHGTCMISEGPPPLNSLYFIISFNSLKLKLKARENGEYKYQNRTSAFVW